MNAAVDRLLLKLSQGDSAKVKSNCSRALKNLSSDASETIEEGAVAALIAMSLEVCYFIYVYQFVFGFIYHFVAQFPYVSIFILIECYKCQGKNRTKGGDELITPEIKKLTIKIYGPPSSVNDKVEAVCWRQASERIKGGAAGRGPLPPEVPIMSTESVSNYPLSSIDELETAVESEGKTKMAFAKMFVPADLKDSFLFTDHDFDVTDDLATEGSIMDRGDLHGQSTSDSLSGHNNKSGSGMGPRRSSSTEGPIEGNSNSMRKSSQNDVLTAGDNQLQYDGSRAATQSPPSSIGPGRGSPKALRSSSQGPKTGAREVSKTKTSSSNISLGSQAAQLKLYS